jgi:ATP-binding cassette, subfamily A (ABC1), member 3
VFLACLLEILKADFCRAAMLIFLTVHVSTTVRSDPSKLKEAINIAYFVIGCISPIVQLLKASIVGLNLFSILCEGYPPVKVTNPGAITLYDGPIVFLTIQSLLLFFFLVWSDHGFSLGRLKSKRNDNPRDPGNNVRIEPEVIKEEARVLDSNDGLRVININKSFKTFLQKPIIAVNNLTFGVKPSEVFALVGPNGGKTYHAPFLNPS